MKRLHRQHLYIFLLLPLLFSFPGFVVAQNYHALEGSSFAGSIGVAHNPASIVNTPFPWDIDILSFQVTNTTNAVTFLNYSLLHHQKQTYYNFNQGSYSRYADINANLHLLNARITIDRKHSIAFGLNLQEYANFKTGTFNYIDTINSLNDFLLINQFQQSFNGNFTSSSWLEFFGTYSQTIFDDGKNRLNAGFTLRAMRGVSGVFADLQQAVTKEIFPPGGSPNFLLTNASLKYGYSNNYDNWQKNQTLIRNTYNFLNRSTGRLAIDLGAEYLIRDDNPPYYREKDPYYKYEWKIGVSLLDAGFNTYRYGVGSYLASGVKNNITSDTLQEKFQNIKNTTEFNDSLMTIVNNFYNYTGEFSIMNPMRMVINVDKKLPHHFFLNGDLSINLSPYIHGKWYYVKALNFITITPRWETSKMGVYLPVQYTAEGRLWVGAAFKLGPLLLGFHNLGNIFEKDKMQNGGGYLAIIIRPSDLIVKPKLDKRLNCPSL